MLSIFNGMFRTATRNHWDAPNHWKQDDTRKSGTQLQREQRYRQKEAMHKVGGFW